jgi:hypothetical protein
VRAVRAAVARLVGFFRALFGERTEVPLGFVEIDEDDSVAALDEIQHVVVLMLENRSFDHMLGYLALEESGLDVDVAAYLARAVREAVARSTSTSLVREDAAEVRLEVVLLGASSPLQPFADPNLRAAQYVATVSLRARLVDKRGQVVWTSEVINGEAPFLSPQGRIEVLDGVRRTALSRAADDAASRLIASMSAAL